MPDLSDRTPSYEPLNEHIFGYVDGHDGLIHCVGRRGFTLCGMGRDRVGRYYDRSTVLAVLPLALERVVNWRDPVTSVIHVVNYSKTNAWGSRTDDSDRWMVCGLVVNVLQDATLASVGTSLIMLPWMHTTDDPTCIACVAGVRYTSYYEDYARIGGYVPGEPNDDSDVEENDDPLDGDLGL